MKKVRAVCGRRAKKRKRQCFCEFAWSCCLLVVRASCKIAPRSAFEVSHRCLTHSPNVRPVLCCLLLAFVQVPLVLLLTSLLLCLLATSLLHMSKPELDDPTQLKKQKLDDMSAAAPAAAAAAMHAQDIALDKIPPSAVVPAAKAHSWIPYTAESHFPLQNLPYGVFTRAGDERRRIGVAVGEHVVDLSVLAQAGLFASLPGAGAYFAEPTLNAFMSQGRAVWKQARALLTELLQEGSGNTALSGNAELRTAALVAQSAVKMHLPATIGDYTDFYSSKYHAYNVGVMFRGKDNALQPNWTWLPVGYHGRSSSVVVSGEGIHRPNGQLQPDEVSPIQASAHVTLINIAPDMRQSRVERGREN